MNLERIDHVGVVVRDLEDALGLLRDGFGLEVTAQLSRPDLEARFLRCGDVSIELIEVKDPAAREARLGAARARIEHIAIEVDDVLQTLEGLRSLGVQPEGPPRPAAGGLSVWTQPESSGGMTFQFLQPAR